MGREPKKRGMGGGEGGPQGRLSLFVFPLPSTGQTVTRKRGKSERRRRTEGLREAAMENKQALTCLGSAMNRTSNFPAVGFPAVTLARSTAGGKTTAVGTFLGEGAFGESSDVGGRRRGRQQNGQFNGRIKLFTAAVPARFHTLAPVHVRCT